jgi:saccharopine dehydrogenase-like NADP-dependent oxidoreductase
VLGALEAFPSDGLRTLLASFPDVPHMAEWTLRWPGHLDFMQGLLAAGLLDERGPPGAPEPAADATARALAAAYPSERHPDALRMEVAVDGLAWSLLDRRDAQGRSAMSRTTAFTASAVAWQLARGRFAEPGVHPPERLGVDAALVRDLVADLAARGVVVRRSGG